MPKISNLWFIYNGDMSLEQYNWDTQYTEFYLEQMLLFVSGPSGSNRVY